MPKRELFPARSGNDPNGTDEANAERGRWRELASTAAAEFRDRLGAVRSLRLKPRDRERVARRLRDTIDSAMEVPPDLPERIRADTERWRTQRGGRDPVALAWERTRERARRTAAVGAATAIPAVVPGFGSAVAALGLVADWRYVAEQQRDLVLEIAAILGVMPTNPTEQVRRLFVASAGTAFGSKAAGETLIKVAAGQVARRSLARMLPGVGVAVTGALNYLTTLAIGRAAIAQFAAETGREVRGIIPAERHPLMPVLRRAVVGALETAELADGEPLSAFSPEQRATLAALSPAERDELLDLAVITAAGDGRSSERESETLREIAGALGMEADWLDELRAAAEREVESYRKRFGKLLRSARERGAANSRAIWQRARKLARRG